MVVDDDEIIGPLLRQFDSAAEPITKERAAEIERLLPERLRRWFKSVVLENNERFKR